MGASNKERSYVVYQFFRGVAAFLVTAHTAKEAMAKLNAAGREEEGVECIDRDVVSINKAVHARLDRKRGR